MKTKIKILILIVLSISINGISQSNSGQRDFYIKFLTGEWKEYKVCGGYAGVCENRSLLKEVITPIEGTSDSLIWKTYYNNSFWQQTKSKISFEKSELSQDSAWILNSDNMKFRISYIDTNTLTLSMGGWDGQSHFYIREKTSSVEEILDKSNVFVLFPNPCGNTLNIRNIENFAEIEIYDLNNRLLFINQLSSQNKATIDITDLKPGAYCIQLQIKNKIQRKIFIKNQ